MAVWSIDCASTDTNGKCGTCEEIMNHFENSENDRKGKINIGFIQKRAEWREEVTSGWVKEGMIPRNGMKCNGDECA